MDRMGYLADERHAQQPAHAGEGADARKTSIAWPVCCSVLFGGPCHNGPIMARRYFLTRMTGTFTSLDGLPLLITSTLVSLM